jgi:hypothetical protein
MLKPETSHLPYRLFFYKSNFIVAENVRRLAHTMHHAKAAGYNGIVLDDYKFQILDRLSPNYFRHLEEIKRTAAELQIALYPMVARFGYSNGLLAHDPNLAEGLPVVRAPYTMRDGYASLLAEPPIRLTADQTVRVSRFRQYHLAVDVKTENFRAMKARPAVLAPDGRRIGYFDRLPVSTQDWTTHHLVFNSLNNDRVEVRPIGWLKGGSDVSFRNALIHEVGLINTIRRNGAPLTVTDANATATYQEGVDFAIENNRPPGLMPRPGEFDAYHESPRLLSLPNSRIRDGQTILISYYHATIVREGGVICCLGQAMPYDIVRDQIARLQEILHPKGFFLGIDEVRVANWCESCRRRSISPGAMVAETTRRCIEMVRDANSSAKILVWSDMFDPFHNAHDHYYLANGDLAGSWKGLDKDIVIATWNYAAREQSLKWFASLGHPQIVTGFYDRSVAEMEEWSRAAAKISRISGAMYTTWRDDYSHLETFAELMWDRARA